MESVKSGNTSGKKQKNLKKHLLFILRTLKIYLFSAVRLKTRSPSLNWGI
jgi:hypothetical protein